MAFIQSTSPSLLRSSHSYAATPLTLNKPSGVATTCHPLTAPFTIEAAKRPQFKATKKAERFRPRKHRPSDINRAPPSFDPEPLRAEGIPAVYEIVKGDVANLAPIEEKLKAESRARLAAKQTPAQPSDPVPETTA